MIIYNPLDGMPLQYSIRSQAKQCLLLTKLEAPIPQMVADIRTAIEQTCGQFDYNVIDAGERTTGRDFLLKVWRLIASMPLSIGILHEDMPQSTQANIFYEFGVAQALGKETIIVKSPKYRMPSDFVRTEYVPFDGNFSRNFKAFIESIYENAKYYETIADQLEKNPVLALDFLKRAFLINGDVRLKERASQIVGNEGLDVRAGNSVEAMAAAF